jgi:hypothetical protein
MVAVMTLAVAAGVARHPDIAMLSAEIMAENMFHPKWRMWGLTWPAVIALAVLAGSRPSFRFSRAFTYAVPLSFAFIYFIGTQVPWRLARNDSANRMVMHLLPLIALYFVIKFAPIYGADKREMGASTSESSPSTSASP